MDFISAEPKYWREYGELSVLSENSRTFKLSSGNRSEISLNKLHKSGIYSFQFDIFLPLEFSQCPHWQSFCQWHDSWDAPPELVNKYKDGVYMKVPPPVILLVQEQKLFLQVVEIEPPYIFDPVHESYDRPALQKHIIEICDAKILEGRWGRFEILIDWSESNSGRIDVKVDGDFKATHNGRNMYNHRGNFWKLGYYRHHEIKEKQSVEIANVDCKAMSDISVIIPAKGTSTRIPNKNMVDWRGKPLILWSIEYALQEGFQPIVITDSSEIAEYSRRCGAIVLDEPTELAAPDAKMVNVAQWVAQQFKKHVVLLQCTSPTRRPGMIREALKKLNSYDSVFSGARMPADFVVNRTGKIINRALRADGTPPFSQEMQDDPQWLLTGALFAMRYPEVMNQKECFFGNAGVLDANWRDTVDVDWPEDIERPSVIVVGNASNLKDRKLGWLIDQYDVVIRSNFFKTEDYGDSVGSRTTHWAVVCAGGILDLLAPTDCTNFVEVWPRYSGSDEEYDGVCARLMNPKNIKKICGYSIMNNFERWNVDRHRLPVPTTGMVSIAEALDRWGAPVDVAGYGPADKYVPGYYYPSSPVTATSHDYDAERILINEWEQDGLIRRIDQ